MSALTLLAAPLVVAGVLAVSGVAKLGDVSEGVRGLRELQVPDWLVRDGVARAHPIAEIVIGLGLVLLPTPWRTVAAVAALGLLAAYTVLVLAALRRAREVRCNCFGRRSEVVNRATAVRNLALLALALAALVDCREASAPVVRVFSGLDPLAWTAILAVTAGVGWLIGRGYAAPAPPAAAAGPAAAAAGLGGSFDGRAERDEWDEADEWLEDEGRLPIPAERLRSADGTTTTLAELVTERAAVLLFLEPTCGSCARLLDDLSAWRRVMPEIRIVTVRTVPDPAAHLGHRHGPPPTDGTGEPFPTRPGGYWAEASITGSFGTNGFTPWAVLLGADGLVAGGPVAGSVAVRAFLAEVLTHLAGGA
ncbi:MAG: MauE/DoxX family redox-associated membrane protein [Candidatus Phosphoribacter baldrii]